MNSYQDNKSKPYALEDKYHLKSLNNKITKSYVKKQSSDLGVNGLESPDIHTFLERESVAYHISKWSLTMQPG